MGQPCTKHRWSVLLRSDLRSQEFLQKVTVFCVLDHVEWFRDGENIFFCSKMMISWWVSLGPEVLLIGGIKVSLCIGNGKITLCYNYCFISIITGVRKTL